MRTERQQRERRLAEQRAAAKVMKQTNEALLQRQYPDGAQQPEDGGPREEAVSDEADLLRSLSRATGAGSLSALTSSLLAQQASRANLVEMRDLARRQVCAGGKEELKTDSVVRFRKWSHTLLLDLVMPPPLKVEELQNDVALERAHLDDLRSGGRLTTQAQLDSAQVCGKSDELRPLRPVSCLSLSAGGAQGCAAGGRGCQDEARQGAHRSH